MTVLCTLGYFDESGEGALVEVDLAAGTARVVLRATPPPPLRVSAKGFTGACWAGRPGASTLLVCGHAALFHIAADLSQVQETWHQPCMNDLHHVAVHGGRVHVVNTGMEALDVFSRAGQFLGSHAVHPGWVSAARQQGQLLSREALAQGRDARWPPAAMPQPVTEDAGYYARGEDQPFWQAKVRDLVHMNHVAFVGAQILVTRMLDRSVLDLATFTPVIEDTPGAPHDGIVHQDLFWVTCSNGIVAAYAIEHGQVTGRMVRSWDVFARTGHSGWCRGLLVTDESLIIGLSEIRRMPRVRWCERPFSDTETSILCIDQRTGALLSRVDLTDAARQSKIFSILPRGGLTDAS